MRCRPPLLITLSGPEGSGKSTNQRFIVRLLEDRGVHVRPLATSFLTTGSLTDRLLRRLRVRPDRPRTYSVEGRSASPQQADSGDGPAGESSGTQPSGDWNDSITGRVRRRALRRGLVYLLDAMILRLHLRRPAQRKAGAIICDRYLYDAMSKVVEHHPWLVRHIRRIMPGPDLAFILTAPVNDLLARRPRSSPEYHRMRLRQFEALRAICTELIVIDGSNPQTVQSQIAERLDAHLDGADKLTASPRTWADPQRRRTAKASSQRAADRARDQSRAAV